MLVIPIAPPATHRILPTICGSGTNGAKPKVTDANDQRRSCFLMLDSMGQKCPICSALLVTDITERLELLLKYYGCA